MKKIIFFAFAAAALVGCVKESLNTTVEGTPKPMTISAGVDTDTKAHLDGKTVVWDATDVLGLYDGGSTIKEFTTSEDKINGASADFTGEADHQDMYYAVYPHSDAVGFDASTTTFTTSIPTTQTASVGGGFMNGAYIAVAKADCASGEPLRFKNVCSYIKVTVSEANVKKVVVKSTSGSKLLTGKINVKVTDGDPETTVYDGSTLVYLVPASGSDYIAPGTYYIAVAPQSLNASEYTIRKVYDSTMKVWTGTKAFELKRNTPVNFGDLAADNFAWEVFNEVDLNGASSTGVLGKSLRYTLPDTNGWDWAFDGDSGTYTEIKSSEASTHKSLDAGKGSWASWFFGIYQNALVFEYQTPTLCEGDDPAPGYNMIPWTLSLLNHTDNSGYLIYKTLSVESDALPWESGQTYSSDVITYSGGEIRCFRISCFRTRTNTGTGVSPKDATENVTFNDFLGTVAPASWALAELKLWVKE